MCIYVTNSGKYDPREERHSNHYTKRNEIWILLMSNLFTLLSGLEDSEYTFTYKVVYDHHGRRQSGYPVCVEVVSARTRPAISAILNHDPGSEVTTPRLSTFTATSPNVVLSPQAAANAYNRLPCLHQPAKPLPLTSNASRNTTTRRSTSSSISQTTNHLPKSSTV